jgi:3-methyladenine DNA glycosylase AlkD
MLASRIEMDLWRHRDPRRAVAEKAYLKSDLEFIGVTLPALRQMVRAFKDQNSTIERVPLVRLAETLWRRRLFETRMMAVLLLETFASRLQPTDIELLERLIRESKTWALVDELAIVITGPLLQRSPQLARTLDRWARDDDFWLRRAAMLALLPPLRRGEGDFPRFARYADTMLAEREFFIRKAIGWVLRETGKRRPDVVYRWLLPRCTVASGVTVREAVKYLSSPQRAELLAAYRRQRHRLPVSGRAPR